MRPLSLLAALMIAPLPAAAQALLHEPISPNEEFQGYFGQSVAGVPDVDGDGIADLLVGAVYEDPGTSPEDAGRAHVFNGASGALLYTLASPNEQSIGYFGMSVSGVEDVDGDGRGDLLVGAPSEDPGTSPAAAGRAYLFSGSSVLSIAAAALNSPVPLGDRLRFTVSLANHTPDPLTGDLVLDITGPDGATYSRLLEDDRTLEGGATRTPEYRLPVGDDAALGLYTATVTALEGGVTNLGEATFTFEVIAGAARTAGGSSSERGSTFGAVEVLADGVPSGGAAPPAQSSGTEAKAVAHS
jgi:hypothetical protein